MVTPQPLIYHCGFTKTCRCGYQRHLRAASISNRANNALRTIAVPGKRGGNSLVRRMSELECVIIRSGR